MASSAISPAQDKGWLALSMFTKLRGHGARANYLENGLKRSTLQRTEVSGQDVK